MTRSNKGGGLSGSGGKALGERGGNRRAPSPPDFEELLRRSHLLHRTPLSRQWMAVVAVTDSKTASGHPR
jgi:hypothetical protein